MYYITSVLLIKWFLPTRVFCAVSLAGLLAQHIYMYMVAAENTMAESAFRLPSKLNISVRISENGGNRWRFIWRQLVALSRPRTRRQIATLLHCAGPQVIEIYDQFKWDNPEDKNDVSKVLGKLKLYCIPRTNEVIEETTHHGSTLIKDCNFCCCPHKKSKSKS